jgi:hypothetical protein
MTGLDSPHVFNEFEKIAPQLFNLESSSEPEKTLQVDLDLYQMENC